MNEQTHNSPPLVSIMMNCYNGEKYLREAIESVLNQTYTNFEIVFWDNQSTDKSAEIFKEYTQDNRLKYFLSETHTTQYEARNCALSKAQGDFIAFLDVDDWWLPNKLEKQIPLFESEGVGLVYSNFIWQNELTDSEYIAHNKTLPEGFIVEEMLNNYVIGLLTAVIRKQTLEKLDYYFNPEFNVIGDFDLFIRLANISEIKCVQKPLGHCRWHGNNLQITQANRSLSELSSLEQYYSTLNDFTHLEGFKTFQNTILRLQAEKNGQEKEFGKALSKMVKVRGLKNKFKVALAIVLPAKFHFKLKERLS